MQRFDSEVAAAGQTTIDDVETGHAETVLEEPFVGPGHTDDTLFGDLPCC